VLPARQVAAQAGLQRLGPRTREVQPRACAPAHAVQGSVTCANPLLLELLPEFKSAMEVEEGIIAKCSLQFDSLPFIPAEPYNIIR
jgi:hypothetical protein